MPPDTLEFVLCPCLVLESGLLTRVQELALAGLSLCVVGDSSEALDQSFRCSGEAALRSRLCRVTDDWLVPAGMVVQGRQQDNRAVQAALRLLARQQGTISHSDPYNKLP